MWATHANKNWLKKTLINVSLLNRVLDVVVCSRACVLECFACSRAWRAYVLTWLQAYVLAYVGFYLIIFLFVFFFKQKSKIEK